MIPAFCDEVNFSFLDYLNKKCIIDCLILRHPQALLIVSLQSKEIRMISFVAFGNWRSFQNKIRMAKS